MATLFDYGQLNKKPTEADVLIAKYLSEVASIEDVLEKEDNFFVFSNLSSWRGELFRWYEFGKESYVLEIGAGFGPITGVLCEKSGYVVATERSLYRAEQLAKRYEEYDNLEIHCCDISELETDRKFDYVVLTGLLERIGAGSSDWELYADYLKQLKNLLKKNGKILLSVDNRLGLRAFCGERDAHGKKAFSGVRGYLEGSKGRRFSKVELIDILVAAGIEHYKFYYPLPDYRFPQFIYTDKHLPKEDIGERLLPYYTKADTLIADECTLYKDIISGGSFPFMANSFLVECSMDGQFSAIESYALLDEENTQKRRVALNKWTRIDKKRIVDNASRLESEKEEIADYVVSDSMKKVWKVELRMLDAVDEICKKYHLSYFFVHGSLLGAIRHKGFIPWDDDLDLAMPRGDYDKFLKVAAKELEQNPKWQGLSVHAPWSEDEMFWGGFSRMRDKETTAIELRNMEHKGNQGIFVDILPLDVVINDEKKFEKQEQQILYMHKLLLAKCYGKYSKRWGNITPKKWKWYQFLAAFRTKEQLGRKLDEIMKRYSDTVSEEVAFMTSTGKHVPLNSTFFDSTVLLDFMQRKIPCPIKYDEYLTRCYGQDYMKFPPKEERKPKHGGIWNPQEPYESCVKRLCGIFEDCKGKRIILFGAGLMFEDYMSKYGPRYRPSFLVDNDENKWGRSRMGIKIYSPEKILEVPEDKRRVIICSYYYPEIEKQLKEMGIKDYRIYTQHIEWIVNAEKEKQE